MEIWNTIVQTNTFNFIIFVIIFAIIFKFAKVGNMITSLQDKVKQYVDDSVKAKEASIQELNKAQEKADKVDFEIKEIIDDADLNAVRLGRKIMADANIQSENILLNADKKDSELMNDICLHIASSAPKFVSREEIPQSVIDEETRIEMGKEDLLKKPENIRAKIVEGRVNKLMAERCLLEQPFVKDPNVTVGQLIEGKLTIKSFTRWELGEGLEKRQDNFAEEVMAQVAGK